MFNKACMRCFPSFCSRYINMQTVIDPTMYSSILIGVDFWIWADDIMWMPERKTRRNDTSWGVQNQAWVWTVCIICLIEGTFARCSLLTHVWIYHSARSCLKSASKVNAHFRGWRHGDHWKCICFVNSKNYGPTYEFNHFKDIWIHLYLIASYPNQTIYVVIYRCALI